ncbi:MAG: ABC transporter ATP-binding protein [Nitrosospira sp.]|nr:ABC transporter ATP-binding protein [Nitrosospira sp.]MDW7643277.1 ABC transporter ATP-binding protein [Nitrosomonadaceae bacterium]MBA0922427.1 ABC transporter ATP-binding protein [Nitrosospira sp.]MBI0407775.1 ABC transporter ATP-binding protein [Nitrosospira sp.]MBI0414956.1 ABC transporter ATP-binding protein [Nitrosospira sp.]
MNLLTVYDLKVSYGGIRAVRGINLEIYQGEIVALIGANGAGKSTTLRALAGLERPVGGVINYQGHTIEHYKTHELVRKGLALTPEGRGIFELLTVQENLLMGAYCRNDTEEIQLDIDKIFKQFPRLQERNDQVAGTMSGGEQQMLAIGRALMSRPKLLLLDEPSMGLAPLMVKKIFESIRTISAAGVTILLVEQNAKLALTVSHRGYVMENGLITLDGEAQTLLNNEKVRHAYLGE